MNNGEGALMPSATKCILVAAAMAAWVDTATAVEGACKADAQKFCKGMQPGEGRLLSCLNKHLTQISPSCAVNLKQYKGAVQRASGYCAPDIERFCWDVPVGKGGIESCLKQHSEELEPDCKDALARAEKTRRKAESGK